MLLSVGLVAVALSGCGDENTTMVPPTTASTATSESASAPATTTPSGDTVPDSEREVATFSRASATVATAEPTAAPLPTATQQPEPTATATAVPVAPGPWLTAVEAIGVANGASGGQLFEISAHVSLAAGETSSSELTSRAASPAAEYALEWWLSYQNADGTVDGCTVTSAGADCGNYAHPDLDMSITDFSIDSPTAFNAWDGDADWVGLQSNDSLTVLLALRQKSGTPGSHTWSASITVHGEANGASSGNFEWDVETGDKTSWTF